jgi:hypothetical protein
MWRMRQAMRAPRRGVCQSVGTTCGERPMGKGDWRTPRDLSAAEFGGAKTGAPATLFT